MVFLRASGASGSPPVQTLLAEIFERRGWTVSYPSAHGDDGVDMMVKCGPVRYAVQVKMSSEGRPDRLVPLWSQAALQSLHSAEGARALAVVAAPAIGAAATDRVLEFAARYAPEVAVGVIDFAGLSRFRGEGLEALDSDPPRSERAAGGSPTAVADLFSDLNQWMLKVLIAPAVPEDLLAAPRDRFRSASQLARAADVSVMSAHRFLQQLDAEGFLDRAARHVQVMDRERLFARWRAAAARPAREVPVRVLLGDPMEQAARIAGGPDACLALFAAADALGIGFVHGVAPHVYLGGIGAPKPPLPDAVVPAARGERPDVVLRQPRAARSVFRGAVRRGDVAVADVVQTWLDVASHPARGAEQADLIWSRVLFRVAEREDG